MATDELQLASLDLYLIPVAALAAVAAYATFSLILRRIGAGVGRRLPPGPPAWPLVGNLHMLGDLPHQSLAKLALSYGPLMSMRFGSILFVVASTPQMAKLFLQEHDSTFASRPRTAATFHTLFNNTNLGFAPYGSYWKFIRRVCVTHVFHPRCLESFKPIRLQEAHNLIHSVSRFCSQPVVLRPRVQEATNNVISRMTLGKKYIELSSAGSTDDILAIVDEIILLLGVPNVGDFIPPLAWMDLQGWEKRMKAVRKKVQRALGEIIEQRRAELRARAVRKCPVPDQPENLLDVLLNVALTEQKDSDVQLTDDNITAVILKVQEELDKVVGRERLVEDSDMEELPYLRAVVQETFRLHPVAPLLLPRVGMQACSVAGYDIPADTRVYVNVWAIGRDRGTWEDPLAFQPERFVGSAVVESGQHFQLLPFGSGRRRCVALELGLLSVRLLLARLLQCFEWTLPPGVGKMDMQEQFGLSAVLANPLTLNAFPRLPSSFYREFSSLG